MRKLLVITSFILLFLPFTKAYSGPIDDIQINFNSKVDLYNNMIEPLWETIPYEYQWPAQTSNTDVSNTISLQLLNGFVKLAPSKVPLASLAPYDVNKMQVDWKLSQINVTTQVKVTFRFKKFGIKITHSEVFDVQALGISGASSKVALNYSNDLFSFKLIENNGFLFDSVIVNPRDGVGEVLKWIFEHIFSKSDVDRYLRDEVNKELTDWANNIKLIKDLENSVNQELSKLENLKVRMSDLATNLDLSFKDFNFTKEKMLMKLSVNFDNSNSEVHPCAKDIETPFVNKFTNNGDITISKRLVENILNNYTKYEIFKDDKLIEPLFCFGYKEFDEKGNPKGIKESFKVLGLNTKFTYWITPLIVPSLEYDHQSDSVTARLKAKIIIKSKGYPKIKIKGKQEAIFLDVKARFNIIHKESVGVGLSFIDFEVEKITGKVKVKLFALSPAVKISNEKLTRELEKMVTKELSKNNQFINLIDEKLTISGNIKLKMTSHDLIQGAHKIQFDLKE